MWEPRTSPQKPLSNHHYIHYHRHRHRHRRFLCVFTLSVLPEDGAAVCGTLIIRNGEETLVLVEARKNTQWNRPLICWYFHNVLPTLNCSPKILRNTEVTNRWTFRGTHLLFTSSQHVVPFPPLQEMLLVKLKESVFVLVWTVAINQFQGLKGIRVKSAGSWPIFAQTELFLFSNLNIVTRTEPGSSQPFTPPVHGLPACLFPEHLETGTSRGTVSSHQHFTVRLLWIPVTSSQEQQYGFYQLVSLRDVLSRRHNCKTLPASPGSPPSLSVNQRKWGSFRVSVADVVERLVMWL